MILTDRERIEVLEGEVTLLKRALQKLRQIPPERMPMLSKPRPGRVGLFIFVFIACVCICIQVVRLIMIARAGAR